MADVTISLDSSDIPVILDALRRRRESLESHDESSGQGGAPIKELDLLINTFEMALS